MKPLAVLFLIASTILSPLRLTKSQEMRTFIISSLSYQQGQRIYGRSSFIPNKLHRRIKPLSNLWKSIRLFGGDPEYPTMFLTRSQEEPAKGGRPNQRQLGRSADYSSEVYLPDTVVMRGLDVPVRCSYSYNADGRMVSELIEKRQNSQWIDSLLYTLTYDEYGREYSQMDQVWQTSQWVKDGLITYSYDPTGNVTTVFYDNWQGGKWTHSGCMTYTYDSNGNALTMLLNDWEDSSSVPFYGEKYTYDVNGKVLTVLHELYDSTQTVYYSWQATYTYDAKGNVLTEFDDQIQSPSPNDDRRTTTYKYDSCGHVLTMVVTDDYSNIFRIDYTYDAQGNQTSESEWSGHPLTLFYHDTTTYDYDSNGNLRLLVHQDLLNAYDAYHEFATVTFNRIANFYSFYGDTITLIWERVRVPSVKVTSLTVQASLDSVEITWNTLYEESIKGFNILRKIPTGSGLSVIAVSIAGRTPNVPGIDEGGKRYSFVDSKLEGAGTYLYRLEAVNADGSTDDLNTVEADVGAPSAYALYQNYPNPFNSSTTITFDLNRASLVTLDIYNMLGQKVVGWNYGGMNPGRYHEVINMSKYGSGVYFYRLVAGNFAQTKKLLLLK